MFAAAAQEPQYWVLLLFLHPHPSHFLLYHFLSLLLAGTVSREKVQFFVFHPVLWIRIRSDPELFAGSGSGIKIISDPDPANPDPE
jgi:hypothetical protein